MARVLRIALLAVLVLGGLCSPASAAGLAATQRALAREMAGSGPAAGAYVIDLDTGAELFADDPDVPRVPASVNKLFTTAAALLRFGPEATLPTSVLAQTPPDASGRVTGNLYLRGGGDPTFSTSAARGLAARLAGGGLSAVTGRVVGDESAWDVLRGGPESGYRTSGWVGPLSALSFNRGLTGRRRPYFQSDPPRSAAAALTRALERAGIDVARGARSGITPPGATALDAWPSPTMAALAARANIPSDNFIAESLLKALGARFGLRGSTAAGATVVRATVARLGATPRIVDGSGLSRQDRTTPRDVVELIAGMGGTPQAEAFAASLPVAGRTGTLAKRMRRTAALDRCRGKTGTLWGVSALAGICATRGGRNVTFAFLMNGAALAVAHRRQDRMTAALARYG